MSKLRYLDDGPDIDTYFFRCLPEIDGAGLADAAADIAFAFLEAQAALVNIGHQGNSLIEVDVYGLVVGYLLVERVRVFHRAVLHTGGAARTLVFENVAGFLLQGNLEIPFFTFDPVHLRERQNLYVRMPADLDQFR